jgi:hypothetical protein
MSFIDIAAAIGLTATAEIGADAAVGAGVGAGLDAGAVAGTGSALGDAALSSLAPEAVLGSSSLIGGADTGLMGLSGVSGLGSTGSTMAASALPGATADVGGAVGGGSAITQAAGSAVAPSATLGSDSLLAGGAGAYDPAMYEASSVGAQMGAGSTGADTSGSVGSQVANAASKAPQSFLDKYGNALALGGIGTLVGGLGTLIKPTQATPPGQVYNPFGMIRFNPRTFQAPQPTYIRTGFAGGGITSLNQTNPDPNMMNSGSDSTDFMGQGAYPMSQQKLSFYSSPTQMPTSAQQAMASYEPNTNPLTGEATNHFASGGIADLGRYSDGGRMTRGPGDGMSDDIPATIADKQPARLADSEFVVPADVVSHLGNGSTDAGAKQLYAMMDRVRKARTGKKAQAKQINAARMMPA